MTTSRWWWQRTTSTCSILFYSRCITVYKSNQTRTNYRTTRLYCTISSASAPYLIWFPRHHHISNGWWCIIYRNVIRPVQRLLYILLFSRPDWISIFPPFIFFFLLINRSKYDIGHNQHQNVYSRCKSALYSLESSGNQQNALDWDTETLAGRYRRKEYEVATVVLQRGIYSNCKQPGTILYTYRQAKYLADGI